MKNISVATSKQVQVSKSVSGNLEKVFEDKDNNGVPDIFDEVVDKAKSSSQTIIEINGKKYNSWDEVPEAERKQFEPLTKMGKVLDNKDEGEREVAVERNGQPLIPEKVLWLLVGIVVGMVARGLFRL